MKPFDLEKAKVEDEVLNRVGQKVVILDLKFNGKNPEKVVAGKVMLSNGTFILQAFRCSDLFMAPVKKKGFIAIVPNVNADGSYSCTRRVYNSIDKALSSIDDFYKSKAIAIPIEWEE